MIMYDQESYEENDQDAIKMFEIIILIWNDIGQRGMKYEKQSIIEEIKLSFMIHLMEELIKENDPMLMMMNMNMKQLRKNIIQLLYGYLYWSFRAISTFKMIEIDLNCDN
jgi:hypothetical protein